MTGVASRASPAVLANCIDSNAPTLPPPTTLSGASLWMQAAAHRIVNRNGLSEKERASILAIAQAAAKRQKNNAFWPEMEAVIYADGGMMQQAIDAWIRASECPTWDDFQTQRLMLARSSLVATTGIKESWQLAYLYFARSEDVAYCIRSLAGLILSRADYDTPKGLALRYATLLNGEQLQHHAHSTKSSISATDIVNLSTYPAESISAQFRFKPKMVWAGEIKVVNNLTTILHQPDWTQRARKIYKQLEGEGALSIHETNEEQAERLALGSVLCSSIASAFLVVSALGAIIWSMGGLVAWRLAGAKNIKPTVAAGTAIALGGIVQVLTGYFPASIAAALCAAFLTVAPDHSRHSRPKELGPLFGFMAIVLGLTCSAMFAAYLIGSTPAANAVLPSLGVPSDYVDKPLMAGLAAVSFGLVLLIAPIWAVAHRVGTPHVLSLILVRFGSFVCIMGFSLSIVLGPLAVYADRRLETTLTQLVENEPIHYYIQQ